jgi:hypothetical protein
VAVLGDNYPLGQPLAENVCDSGGHRHGGLATTDDEHTLVVAQVVAATGDLKDRLVPFTTDVTMHRGPWFDGGQRGLLEFGGDSAQIWY